MNEHEQVEQKTPWLAIIVGYFTVSFVLNIILNALE